MSAVMRRQGQIRYAVGVRTAHLARLKVHIVVSDLEKDRYQVDKRDIVAK